MIKNMFGKKRNLIVLIVIFVGVTIYIIARGGMRSPYSLSVANETISVTGDNEYSFSLPMQDIASIELTQIQDYGTCIEGSSDRSHICGVYENTAFGRYDLWIIKKIKSAIVVTDKTGHVCVLNYENERSTNELYKALNEMINKN